MKTWLYKGEQTDGSTEGRRGWTGGMSESDWIDGSIGGGQMDGWTERRLDR